MKWPIKICFISLNSYPLFVKQSTGYFGGAELQISLLVKELVKDRNFQVSLICGDYNQPPTVRKKRLTIYKCFKKNRHSWWEAIRFLLTLKKINADVYVERTMNIKVGLVCLFCRIFQKKFVYMLSHDWDSTWQFKNYLQGLSKWWYYFGLKKAHLIIAQTQIQKRRLKKNFGLDSIVMRSLAVKPPSGRTPIRHWLLWVGRADRWKRPEAFIYLAKKLPREKFVMICRQGNNREFYTKIKHLAQLQSNLEWLGAVSHDDIMGYFQQTKVLVNTSVAEGFPNTFLQAGAAKTPIVSLKVNPDNFINQYSCGFCANNNFQMLVKFCQTLLKTQGLIHQYGNNNYKYISQFHSLNNVRILTRVLLDNFGRTAA